MAKSFSLQLPFLQAASAQTPPRKGDSGSLPVNTLPAGPRADPASETSTPMSPCLACRGEGACWGCPLVTQQFLGWKMPSQKWGAHKSVNLLMLRPQKRKEADWLQTFSDPLGVERAGGSDPALPPPGCPEGQTAGEAPGPAPAACCPCPSPRRQATPQLACLRG